MKTIIVIILNLLLLNICHGQNAAITEKEAHHKVNLNQVSNDQINLQITTFCKNKKIPLKSIENDFLKIITIGGLKLAKTKRLLGLSVKALNKLEQWTGRQKIYNQKLTPDAKYHFIFFKSKSQFNAFLTHFIKHSNYSGSSMSRQLGSFSTKKFVFMHLDKNSKRIIENIIVSHISSMAIHSTFSFLNYPSYKAFFLEGVSSNMQYDLCRKKVLCYTISYEMNKLKGPVHKNWTLAVRSTIKNKDTQYRRDTYFLFDMDLVKNSLSDYQQLWSLSRFIILSSKNKRGNKNKFFQLMIESTKNLATQKIIKNVLKINANTLTKKWYLWASRQKS